MVVNNQFDTIYHEHISFFSVKSFCALAHRAGLNVIDVTRTPIHGTSFVFVLSKDLPDQSEKFIQTSKHSHIVLCLSMLLIANVLQMRQD